MLRSTRPIPTLSGVFRRIQVRCLTLTTHAHHAQPIALITHKHNIAPSKKVEEEKCTILVPKVKVRTKSSFLGLPNHISLITFP
jgi:hypothetical protein